MKSDYLPRSGDGFAILGILVILSGCSYHDGFFTYHVDGRVLDANEAPFPQRPIVADVDRRSIMAPLGPLAATGPDERVAPRTDDEGCFSLRFRTGLTWGYMKLFGLIPLGSMKAPVPRRLENLCVAVQVPSGTWRYTDLKLTKEQQHKAASGERWIDVGTIGISDR
jgi:hypothetical protein